MSAHVPPIEKLLARMKDFDASDLHIKVGIPPTYRVKATLQPIDSPALDDDQADHMLDSIVPEALKKRFEESGNLDFAYHLPDGDRFRVNMFRAGRHTHAAIRRVKAEIPNYNDLHLPPVYSKLVEETHEGLVLVVGVTGSGKSSTLAAMLDHLNGERSENVITIEDPIEYRFKHKKSIVSQREIGIDVESFSQALRFVVRQDPDVIFIGELRDKDTVLAAIQAAETGHLVFSTLHTADTMGAFSRMLEFFPPDDHGFVRGALANTLRAICAQRLLPAVDNFESGIVPATEVLLANGIVKEKIREGMDEDLPGIINQSKGEGMHSFTQSLGELIDKDWVDLQTALDYAPNRDALKSLVKGVEVKQQGLVGRIKGGS